MNKSLNLIFKEKKEVKIKVLQRIQKEIKSINQKIIHIRKNSTKMTENMNIWLKKKINMEINKWLLLQKKNIKS